MCNKPCQMISIVVVIFSFKNLHSSVLCQQNYNRGVGRHERWNHIPFAFLIKRMEFYIHRNMLNSCHVLSDEV